MCDRVMGPLFFKESTVKAENYLDMLENFALQPVNNLLFGANAYSHLKSKTNDISNNLLQRYEAFSKWP